MDPKRRNAPDHPWSNRRTFLLREAREAARQIPDELAIDISPDDEGEDELVFMPDREDGDPKELDF